MKLFNKSTKIKIPSFILYFFMIKIFMTITQMLKFIMKNALQRHVCTALYNKRSQAGVGECWLLGTINKVCSTRVSVNGGAECRSPRDVLRWYLSARRNGRCRACTGYSSYSSRERVIGIMDLAA